MEGSPDYGMEGMEDDMDEYGQEGEHYEEDPMDGSNQYGDEGAEYGDENVSYNILNAQRRCSKRVTRSTSAKTPNLLACPHSTRCAKYAEKS